MATLTSHEAVDHRSAELKAQAADMPIVDIVMNLERLVGPSVVATISGTLHRGVVAQAWMLGAEPNDEEQSRLRAGYHALQLIVEANSAAEARSWLMGTDESLATNSPLLALRQGDLERVLNSALRYAHDENGY
jgi:hypothetical protein